MFCIIHHKRSGLHRLDIPKRYYTAFFQVFLIITHVFQFFYPLSFISLLALPRHPLPPVLFRMSTGLLFFLIILSENNPGSFLPEPAFFLCILLILFLFSFFPLEAVLSCLCRRMVFSGLLVLACLQKCILRCQYRQPILSLFVGSGKSQLSVVLRQRKYIQARHGSFFVLGISPAIKAFPGYRSGVGLNITDSPPVMNSAALIFRAAVSLHLHKPMMNFPEILWLIAI